MTVIDMSRPTRGLRLAASWRWHLARALDAAHLPVLGGFALIGRCVVGTRAWFLILAAVLLTQAACGSCPLVVATHWLRHGKSDGRSRRGGLVARVFRRPAPRMVAAAFAIVLIATHTGL